MTNQSVTAFVAPPSHVPWFLRPMLWVTRRVTGKDPLPARLLSWFPKGAVGAGLFELTAAGAPRDLDARSLAIARIVASAVSACPFCVDMNAATWRRAGLRADELAVLLGDDASRYASLGAREAVAAAYARALSLTPVEMTSALITSLKLHFAPKEIVVLATTIAQVNYWARLNQGLGVPSAGFYDDGACKIPERLR